MIVAGYEIYNIGLFFKDDNLKTIGNNAWTGMRCRRRGRRCCSELCSHQVDASCRKIECHCSSSWSRLHCLNSWEAWFRCIDYTERSVTAIRRERKSVLRIEAGGVRGVSDRC